MDLGHSSAPNRREFLASETSPVMAEQDLARSQSPRPFLGPSARKYILLTKREGRTGRISARGLDSTDRAQRGPYKKDRGLIFSQYGPEQAWLIRDLLHD